jgi:hypothetical protein
MSEERRKRQLERDGGASDSKTKKLVTYVLAVIMVAAAWVAGQSYKNHRYDAFAKCLATKQAKMYGLSWCPHCIDQKEKFGESFHYVPYVECGIKATFDETPECKAAGLKLFPSWQFGDEPPKEGVLSLEALSDKTGCSLP